MTSGTWWRRRPCLLFTAQSDGGILQLAVASDPI